MKCKTLVMGIAVLAVSGCAEFRAFKSAVGTAGAAVADETVRTAIWELCNGASVGSIERKFVTEEQKQSRKVLCEIP